MQKGLYKKLNSLEMSFAKNEIHYPDGTTITVADHANATGEVYDGWFWFNTRDEAKAALGVSDSVFPPMPEMLNQNHIT